MPSSLYAYTKQNVCYKHITILFIGLMNIMVTTSANYYEDSEYGDFWCQEGSTDC